MRKKRSYQIFSQHIFKLWYNVWIGNSNDKSTSMHKEATLQVTATLELAIIIFKQNKTKKLPGSTFIPAHAYPISHHATALASTDPRYHSVRVEYRFIPVVSGSCIIQFPNPFSHFFSVSFAGPPSVINNSLLFPGLDISVNILQTLK